MIHKKGGRIRTYSRPAPDLLGWVAGSMLSPLVASVLETDALRYLAQPTLGPKASSDLSSIAGVSSGHPTVSWGFRRRSRVFRLEGGIAKHSLLSSTREA
ncbi:hypothetical protein Droror1_Dr00028072 [Drosera rotundifolia]